MWDHANDSLIDDVLTFDGKPELYFDWILMLENVVLVTKCNPKDLALGKAQGTLINCLKILSDDASWNNVKAKFSLVATVTYAATQLIHKYQQKGETLHECSFKFSELI